VTAVVLDGRVAFRSRQEVAKYEATLTVLAAFHEPCVCSADCPHCNWCGHSGDFYPCDQRVLIDECMGKERVTTSVKTMRSLHPGGTLCALGMYTK
jgi:hypothetical protein